MRYYFIFVFLLSFAALLPAQSDSSSWFLRILNRLTQEDRPPERPRFIVYPTFGYAPETSLEIGLAASLLFHARNDYKGNRLSEMTAFGFGTLRNQYGLWLDNAVYTHRDRWLFLGKARFQRFPLLYFGLGPSSPENDPVVVNGNYNLVRQRVLRQINGNLFAGLQADFQQLYRVDFGGETPSRPLPEGADGSGNLAFGPDLVYDSRPNMLNTRDGWFAELSWLHYSRRLGSQYAFDQYFAEVRRYQSVGKSGVFACQLSGSMVRGNAPFNMLSLMGNEMLMRGYYTGRYRDRHYYAAQAEYRFLPLPFSRRIGAAAFVATGVVAPTLSALQAKNLRLTGGAGLRYLIFPQKDIFIRVDAGFTQEGVSFYIFTGEAF
ncbi:MAG: BamA/TamA family outer membrane protein [Saprospiraceae bacterium]|nr:BamA/TamA family outer membrane protein [Saprospiraceae bacterium]